MGERGDDLWSRLQTSWLQIPVRKAAGRAGPTWEVFSEGFERCFRRICLHVNRRVNDRDSFDRIVTQVLAENLDFLVAQRDERGEMRRVKASADRLLALGTATSQGA